MYFDEEDRDDEEPRTIETFMVDKPGPCVTCGKPEQKYGCYRCGKPVCINETDYWSKTDCGDWILDTWHPAHPDENEFYCKSCLKAYVDEIYSEPEGE